MHRTIRQMNRKAIVLTLAVITIRCEGCQNRLSRMARFFKLAT